MRTPVAAVAVLVAAAAVAGCTSHSTPSTGGSYVPAAAIPGGPPTTHSATPTVVQPDPYGRDVGDLIVKLGCAPIFEAPQDVVNTHADWQQEEACTLSGARLDVVAYPNAESEFGAAGSLRKQFFKLDRPGYMATGPGWLVFAFASSEVPLKSAKQAVEAATTRLSGSRATPIVLPAP